MRQGAGRTRTIAIPCIQCVPLLVGAVKHEGFAHTYTGVVGSSRPDREVSLPVQRLYVRIRANAIREEAPGVHPNRPPGRIVHDRTLVDDIALVWAGEVESVFVVERVPGGDGDVQRERLEIHRFIGRGVPLTKGGGDSRKKNAC